MKKRLLKEEIRIQENHLGSLSIWDKWGPYVSERAWGTVREDYSDDGNAWNYYTYDMARSKVPRWGEDGIYDTGIFDEKNYFDVEIEYAKVNTYDKRLKWSL